MASASTGRVRVPRDDGDDYTREAVDRRREFVCERAATSLEHASSYSFDPSLVRGNVEAFTGVAQGPIGLAGPLLVHGEHAEGEFYVPLASTEGTLVSCYNRRMRLLHEAGGLQGRVLAECQQPASR